MVYSARLRKAVGAVRTCFDSLALQAQTEEFHKHGNHTTSTDAPVVLVACSGGRDSMALAAVSRGVCASRGLRCEIVIVNHHMQSGSDTVAEQTARRCRQGLGGEPMASELVHVVDVHVHDAGFGEEAAARQARYEVIIRLARRVHAAVVLLAHTADDQAETVIMNLKRSSGLEAVAGMPEVTVRSGVVFARPLLGLSRAETTGICEDLHIAWWDDPTNGDLVPDDVPLDAHYPLRSRVRHTLMPFLSDFLQADMVSLLARGASYAREDLDYMNAQTDLVAQRALQVCVGDTIVPYASVDTAVVSSEACVQSTLQPSRVVVLVDEFNTVHAAIRRRVLARALTMLGLRFASPHLEAVDALIVNWHGQQVVALPSRARAYRRRNRVFIERVNLES